MSILEAMAEARPVVATSVGGVPGVLRGCGYVAPPGDVHRLAMGITTLLQKPEMATILGQRGHERLHRKYGEISILAEYRSLFLELAARRVAA
jgi:glycosyltransferase involved in cell wall biosynthesis